MSTGPILASGFERFGHLRRPNPSSEIALPAIEQACSNAVQTIVLPVAFEKAHSMLSDKIREIDPAAVVMFGLSPIARHRISIEQVARNRSLALITPDNLGQRRIGRVVASGPKTIDATLPLYQIEAALRANGIVTRMSEDAGTHVCNELMYRTLLATQGREIPTPTGFVHIGSGLEQSLVEKAAITTIQALQEHLANKGA